MKNVSEPFRSSPGTVFGRLQRLYKASSIEALAELLGEPVGTVKGWSRRDSVPIDRLVAAARSQGASVDWLLGLTSDPQPTFAPASKVLNQSAQGARTSKVLNASELSSVGEPLLQRHGHIQIASRGGPVDFILVPRFTARVSAGDGFRYGDDEVVGEIAFEANWMRDHFGRAGDGFALVDVAGHSMEPTYYDGQTIVVDRQQRDIDGGGVFVLRLQDELFVKRVQRLLAGGLQVISDNPAFRAELVPAGSELQLDVVGRVVWPRSR